MAIPASRVGVERRGGRPGPQLARSCVAISPGRIRLDTRRPGVQPCWDHDSRGILPSVEYDDVRLCAQPDRRPDPAVSCLLPEPCARPVRRVRGRTRLHLRRGREDLLDG